MVKLKAKGHEIEAVAVTGSYNRRAVQFSNRIIAALKKIGVKRDDIDVHLEGMAGRKAKASATWFALGHMMHYGSNQQARFVDNLGIVLKIIEAETSLVFSGKKTLSEFIEEFREDEDIDEKRTKAREFLGVGPDSADLEEINKRYKEMAKELHPDKPTGDTEKFKKLNSAHKTLKRELQ